MPAKKKEKDVVRVGIRNTTDMERRYVAVGDKGVAYGSTEAKALAKYHKIK